MRASAARARISCGVPLCWSQARRNSARSGVATMSAWPRSNSSIGLPPLGTSHCTPTESPRASACFSTRRSCAATISGSAARSSGTTMRSVVLSASAGRGPAARPSSSVPAIPYRRQPIARSIYWRLALSRRKAPVYAAGGGSRGGHDARHARRQIGPGHRRRRRDRPRDGARVAVADFAADAAAATVALVNAAGGQAITLTGDVTRQEDVKAMLDDTIVAHGRLDCAFNNAGIAPYQVDASGKKTADWSEDAFDRMIEVNLKGVWLCLRREIRQMLAQGANGQGGGAIVNTGSIAGLIGLPTSCAYVAAKHGVLGLTKTAALEYADDNIRVNAVCPGFIKTRMTEDSMRRRGDRIMAQIPAGRMGNPEEIAEMVVWLCSERASYVTGACYNVDGGWMAV